MSLLSGRRRCTSKLSRKKLSLVSVDVVLLRHAELGVTCNEVVNEGLHKSTLELSTPKVRCLQLRSCRGALALNERCVSDPGGALPWVVRYSKPWRRVLLLGRSWEARILISGCKLAVTPTVN